MPLNETVEQLDRDVKIRDQETNINQCGPGAGAVSQRSPVQSDIAASRSRRKQIAAGGTVPDSQSVAGTRRDSQSIFRLAPRVR